jgi:acetyl esterase/lipase
MGQDEIETVRALLSSKPRPVGWSERRQRLDEVGSVWPVAGDVILDAVDLGGFRGEWSIVPGSDSDRVLLYFHGGGYCSGSILSHRLTHGDRGRPRGRSAHAGCRVSAARPSGWGFAG